MIRHAILSLAAGATTLALVGYASSRAATPVDNSPVYRPVTSDLMNEVIQPRHIKLWLAGKAGNWTFAEYERHNLQGAFNRMAIAIPTYKGTQVTDMLDAFVKQPFADLDSAIKAKDQVAFTKAYGALTDGCNSCHLSTDHAMAVIKTPNAAAFPDQEFAPPKP
ncbi:MAG: hypothetical protein JWO51_1602 [Rhodospirillales bacterium]|nr:hypothetical protein [Rhodospirillales bacterium]